MQPILFMEGALYEALQPVRHRRDHHSRHPYEERVVYRCAGSMYRSHTHGRSHICRTSREIGKIAEGFLYCVSSLGVTGIREKLTGEIADIINIVRRVSDIPCAIGFGISTPEQARQMTRYADGVIIGSAIVKIIAEYGENSIGPVSAYISQIKKAISEQ